MILRGIAASPGLYAGRATVVEFSEIKLDVVEVLVLYDAGVEFLELLIKAKAVVTEVGGRTSHAASVCREMGKPCVTAVPNLVAMVAAGAFVVVDGSAGKIRVRPPG